MVRRLGIIASVVLVLTGTVWLAQVSPPTRTAASQPGAPPSDPILLAAVQSAHSEELDKLYPGLKVAAERWAQNWRAYLSTSQPGAPVDSKMEFVAVVSPKDHPELTRYLNFWNRSRNSLRTPGLHYVRDAFDKVASDPPEKQAYVLFQDRGRYSVLRFLLRPPTKAATKAAATQPGKAAVGRWDDGDRADLVGAARLGAGIAVTQDALEAARDGKDLGAFSVTGQLRWTFTRPAIWVFYEQKWDTGGLGFFAMEDKLAEDAKTKTRFGLQCRDEARKDYGVNVYLVRDASRKGYLGWRIEKLEAADKPEAEPAK